MIKLILLFVVRSLGALVGFLVVLVVARKLGAEESGYYFWSLSFVTLLATVGRVGLDQSVVRFTAIAHSENRDESVAEILAKSMVLSTVCSVAIICIVIALLSALSDTTIVGKNSIDVLYRATPAILFIALLSLVGSSLQGQSRSMEAILVSMIAVNGLILFALVLFGDLSAVSLSRALSLATLVTLVVGLFIVVKKLRIFSSTTSPSWEELLASCLPLWLVAVMAQITQWSGQLVAVGWASSAEVSQFAVAFRVSFLVGIILMVVNLVLAPKFAALYHQGKLQELSSVYVKSVRYMMLVCCPVLALIYLFSAEIMALFGDGFVDGAPLLRILVVAQFVDVITGSVGWLLSMSGHEKDSRTIAMVCGPIAIIMAFALVPAFGIVGAAISTTFAFSMQNILGAYFVKKRLGFTIFSSDNL